MAGDRPILKFYRNKSSEVIILAWIIFLGSGYKLTGFFDYEYYRFMFQQLPEPWVLPRYCLSIALRVITIFSAIGLIFHKEIFRKVMLFLAGMNIILFYWKHPFSVFFNIAVYSEQGFQIDYPVITGNEVLQYPYFPWISWGFYMMIDVVISIVILYVLTRKHNREKFT